ncbi:MAG: YicC family protein [Phycisphaerales bacterium]|nr:YicC family protein [Phycisphaerales bacterium]
MIRSMTGYGEAAAHRDGVHYFLEVRSLNGRYFKANIRLPEDLQGLEAELEAALRHRVSRGSITLSARCSDTSGEAAYEVNHEALTRYVEQLRKSKAVADGTVALDLSPLLALPGVLSPPSNEEEKLERARTAFMKLLDEAIAKLIAMREREGLDLITELMAHHDQIVERLARIEQRVPIVVDEYQKRLHTRVQTMLTDAKILAEPADLIREVAIYADKTNIAEEIARLSGHMRQFNDLLHEQGARPVGRTLDFLAQEMLREANTIASKSADTEIAREIVEIKSAIDKIKEQVQNAE